MTLLELTNEIAGLVAQTVAFIFPVGIAIYVFQYKNWKESLDKYNVTDIVMGQHQRMSRKIVRLFFTGAGSILYAIAVKVMTFQFAFSVCTLWFLLGGAVLLLLLTLYFLHSIFSEIGLTGG